MAVQEEVVLDVMALEDLKEVIQQMVAFFRRKADLRLIWRGNPYPWLVGPNESPFQEGIHGWCEQRVRLDRKGEGPCPSVTFSLRLLLMVRSPISNLLQVNVTLRRQDHLLLFF